MAIKVPYSEINNAIYNILDHRRTYKVYGCDDDYACVNDDFIKEVVYEMRDYFLSNQTIVNSILTDLKDAIIDNSMRASFVEDVEEFINYTIQSNCMHQIHKAIADYKEDLNMLQKDSDNDRFQGL